jgi:hypothetical protein
VVYAQHPEFTDFPFEPFGRRLQALRKQCAIKHSRGEAGAAAMAHDRQFVGELRVGRGAALLRWGRSDAERFLRLDIANGLHQDLMPQILYQSRVEYQVFSRKVFRGHIHQEVKRCKFLTGYYRQR